MVLGNLPIDYRNNCRIYCKGLSSRPANKKGNHVTKKPSRPTKKTQKEIIGLIGVGLDNQDEHIRLTTGEHYVLYGGSQETHERMVDAAIHVTETLRRKGKSLPEASVEEVIDLLREAHERQG
jgi:hypothetical protein